MNRGSRRADTCSSRRARPRSRPGARAGSGSGGTLPSKRTISTGSSPARSASSAVDGAQLVRPKARGSDLTRASARAARAGSTSRPRPRAPAAAARRRPPGRRVHGDHARLGERQHARRARARDERADLLERRLRRVQHEVARAARVDDAAEDGARAAAPPAPVVGGADQDGLRVEQTRRGNAGRSCAGCCRSRRDRRSRRRGRVAVRARRSRARRRARSCPAAARVQAAGSSSRRERRRGRRATRTATPSGTAASSVHAPKPRRSSSTTFAPLSRDDVEPGDAAIDDAVLDVLGHVVGADEQRLDGRVAARERERAVARRLRAEPRVVQELDRRARAAGPSTGPRSSGALAAPASSASRVAALAAAQPLRDPGHRRRRGVRPPRHLQVGQPLVQSCATCQRCAIASSSDIVQRSRRNRSASSARPEGAIAAKSSSCSEVGQCRGLAAVVVAIVLAW